MPLSKKSLAAVQSLDRKHVQKTLESLKPFLRRSSWLAGNNSYSADTASKIEKEIKKGGLKNPRQLSQYVAASGVLHCTDGWSYVGKAIGALLRGDPHRTRHLAYYAELRAAMSLLASEGIGIFKSGHVVFDGPRSVKALDTRDGTHVVVWDCLEAWGEQQSSGSLFSELITPSGGQNLHEWLLPEGGGATVAAQAKQWFLQWGMDLQTPNEDRRARNESSYRPDGIPIAWSSDGAKALKFVRDTWAALQPSATSRFGNIDRQILRLSIESIFRGKSGSEPSSDLPGFKKFVTRIVEQQGLGEKLEAHWIDFLCRQTVHEDHLIFEYSSLAPSDRDAGHLSVISRAILLLRVASGANLAQLREANYVSDDLDFWWKGLGNSRGLWDGSWTEEAIDLWADIDPLLQAVDTFQTNYAPADRTFHRVGIDLAAALPGLASCERIAVWGMGL